VTTTEASGRLAGMQRARAKRAHSLSHVRSWRADGERAARVRVLEEGREAEQAAVSQVRMADVRGRSERYYKAEAPQEVVMQLITAYLALQPCNTFCNTFYTCNSIYSKPVLK
jgi:hypothetical protein